MLRSQRLVAVLLAFVLLGACADNDPTKGESGKPAASSTPAESKAAPAALAPREQIGSGDWKLKKPATKGQIEGYSDHQSVLPGDPFQLYVSTEAKSFTVEAYRLGGYKKGWGKHVWTSKKLEGMKQAPSELISATNTVITKWKPSVKVDTTGWDPGFYNVKLVNSDGYDYQVPMVVRSPSTKGRLVLAAPTMTYQAYNSWGGFSLYTAKPGQRRGWAVSFDRPDEDPGGGRFMYDVTPTVVLAEGLDIPLAYVADTDVSTDPHLLDGATAYVSAGHDEYWTVPERTTVTAARDAGTNLAFLSANTMYWRVRLESSVTGPNRLVVGYKSDAFIDDPLRESDPVHTTAQWRKDPSPNAENSLIGMLYECYPVDTAYTVVSSDWWGFKGTGVKQGTQFPHLVGPEADRVYPIDSTPHPLQILSNTAYNCGGVPTSTQSTYYTTKSGAGVIGFGSERWPCALKLRCSEMGPESNKFARQVTRNVFAEFAKGPAGARFPAVDNMAEFNLDPENQVPAS